MKFEAVLGTRDSVDMALRLGSLLETVADRGGLIRLAHRSGDREAFDELVQRVYPHLKRIAGKQLGAGSADKTLNATGLVNEAYLKLVVDSERTWENRAHFFAVTARAMRQIIVDHARRKTRKKRGAGDDPLPLDEGRIAVEREAEHMLALDEALEELGREQPRLLRVVECRYFAGLTVDETAEALGASVRTVERDWTNAKRLLKQRLA